MLTLRPYQREAVDAVYRHLRQRDDHPCVVIPTGGGKTPVIATICRDAVELWQGRVIVLAHVKELLEQTVDKLRTVCPELPVGVYSAGLGKRDTGYAVTVAGIQSVYHKADLLGPADLVLVDEAHMIPLEGDGMYRQFLLDARRLNPQMRTIGLTATPFRLKSGSICTPDGILNAVCYEVSVKELIRDGYLSPLKSKAGQQKADISRVHVRGGEFVADELEDLMDDNQLVESACREIVAQTQERRACLVFASGVRHGGHIQRVLEKLGVACGFVTGDTPPLERELLLKEFREGKLKYLVNVNVLTTGFDAPHIDCVALLRPTMSPGLYYQMVGRGFRLSPGKQDCLVLDFGGNVLRHGPVDQLRVPDASQKSEGGKAPAKECPGCRALIAAGFALCPECGHEFNVRETSTHGATAATDGILSGQVTLTSHRVSATRYSVHIKRGADETAPRTMRVDYEIGLYRTKSEWVCFEHDGFARMKALAWWRKRTRLPFPSSSEEAVGIAQQGLLAEPHEITVRAVAGETFDRIVEYKLGAIPEVPGAVDPADDFDRSEPENEPVFANDDIPF